VNPLGLYRAVPVIALQVFDVVSLLVNPGPFFFDPNRPNARRSA
jgi:hypothetical protein